MKQDTKKKSQVIKKKQLELQPSVNKKYEMKRFDIESCT